MKVEIDRLHRALGPRSRDTERSMDIVCSIHRYAKKEQILSAAWEAGDTDFEWAPIKILSDLSRAMLQRRACLHLALDLAREQGCTYRWGYPLAVTFRRASSSFTLRTPADLPKLFAFQEVASIQIPNWLTIIPCTRGSHTRILDSLSTIPTTKAPTGIPVSYCRPESGARSRASSLIE